VTDLELLYMHLFLEDLELDPINLFLSKLCTYPLTMPALKQQAVSQ
jgi:hypothetical protein